VSASAPQCELQKETRPKNEDQNCFRPGRFCVDKLFILQKRTEKRNSVNQDPRFTFIDLEKVYASVPRKAMRK
jgi:hypothetical protein